MIDITNGTEQEVQENYPGNLTYKGQEFFEGIYMNRLMDKADDFMPREAQESYLGYLPQDDVFVEGYDTWQEGEDEEIPNIVFLKIDGEQTVNVTHSMCRKYGVYKYHHTMMYGKNGMYKHLQEVLPNLLDIRLD